MSEEILNALMQLFAIIAKQDDGASLLHKEYVISFLKAQLSTEKVDDYLKLYETFLLGKKDSNENSIEDSEKEKRTSVRDSVKTMAICNKINKTLTQKQKIIVIIRIIEFINKEGAFSRFRSELIETVSIAFNITEEELILIRKFVTSNSAFEIQDKNLLVYYSIEDKRPENFSDTKFVATEGLDGFLTILKSSYSDLYFLKYIGHNDILLNSNPIENNKIYVLPSGGNIRLPKGTIYYSDVITKFNEGNEGQKIVFSVNSISYKFNNGNIGIHPLSISERSGRLVAIMGASGSGKTTLLNLLCGIEQPSDGSIEINGVNVFSNPEKIEGLIGYISQDDLLIEELTVFENLYYYAKLCFGNLSEQEIKEKVEKTLISLGLIEVRDVKVGNPIKKYISGGQRKRLNIALEIIREPAILFVDEPTSGLSSADSENVIDLLKELTLKGKLVFVVIHQPSSDIYKLFDKLILLDTGGYLIYYGNPIEAITYFKKQTLQIKSDIAECYVCGNVNPEQLFSLIESKEVNEYGQAQRVRKVKPFEWAQYYIKNKLPKSLNKKIELPPITTKTPNKLKQLIVFIQREIKSKFANKQYILINLLEAPILALILSSIIRYSSDTETGAYHFSQNENIPAYIFVSIIVSMFIGLTVSAEEIFKDKKLLKQQYFLNLSKLSYLFSKIIILFFISAIQMFTFVLVGNSIVEIKDLYFDYWMMLFAVACVSNIMGLIISSSFDSIISIYILIPLLVIPQMVLGGAMFNFDKINSIFGGGAGKKTPLLAELMISRWAYEGMAVHQFKSNEFQKPIYNIEKMESIGNYKQLYYFPKIDEIIALCESDLNDSSSKSKQQLSENIKTLSNEIDIETKLIPKILYDNSLQPVNNQISEKELAKIKNYFSKLNKHYQLVFNKYHKLKEDYIKQNIEDSIKSANYYNNYHLYFNESLEEIVRNKLTKTPIIIINNRLVQAVDPIYKVISPKHYFDFRTHFYAGEKHFMGKFFDTFKFNVLMIWLVGVVLFLILYWDLLNKLIKFITTLFLKKRSNYELN